MRHVKKDLITKLKGQRILPHENIKFELNIERIRINEVKRG